MSSSMKLLWRKVACLQVLFSHQNQMRKSVSYSNQSNLQICELTCDLTDLAKFLPYLIQTIDLFLSFLHND